MRKREVDQRGDLYRKANTVTSPRVPAQPCSGGQSGILADGTALDTLGANFGSGTEVPVAPRAHRPGRASPTLMSK